MLALASVVSAALAQAPDTFAPPTDRLIVKFRGEPDDANPRPVALAKLRALSARAGVPLMYLRAKSGGAHVLKLDRPRGVSEVEEIARRLREDPEVLYAVPDRVARVQLTPNDPRFVEQWYLQAATSGGINASSAWDLSTGSASVVVAVIDTGILPHADLAGRTVPGYDFVSDPHRSNDGDGRDPDPTDPGDWVTSAEAATGPLAGCPVTGSSWHGTRLAGVIAAASNNATGLAGVNWNSRVLPLRAIGKCGGYTSDIVDAIRWAAGISIAGVPDNPNPARVINLSLATAGACDAPYQSAINEVTARGAVVISAAGNQGQNASSYSPASCSNVVTAGALDRNGGLAPYSNTGTAVAVSAPGGIGLAADGILVASDSGAQSPANDNAYLAAQGSSLAAAQVSGVASLMLSVRPALTPQHVKSILQSAARGFPSGTTAAGSFADCTSSICGRGILNAEGAVLGALAFGGAMPQVSAGGRSTFALRPDGTVWKWGGLIFLSAGSPPAQLSGINGVTQLSVGDDVALMLRGDGTVWSWGRNFWGQLGDGTTTDRSTPLQVLGTDGVGFLADVIAVAVGGKHSLALKSDGSVWAWGDNLYGQLGDGTTTDRLTPVQVKGPGGVGFLTAIIAISAGDEHSLALKSDGTVWSWGHDFYGQLGRGGSTAIPGQVAVLANVVAIAAGGGHSLALKSDGTVWSWGRNDFGQLGNSSTTDASAPVQVIGPGRVGFLGGIAAIAGGFDHSLALRTDGTVWAWGGNGHGQLGNGTTLTADASTIVPAQVPGLNGVSTIDAGGDVFGCGHSVALLSDGTLRAWGCNTYGRLGDGTSTDRYSSAVVLTSAGGISFNAGPSDSGSFGAQLNVPLGTLVTSNTITLGGIGTAVPIMVFGGEYSLNGGAFTSGAGTANSGDTVTVRQTSSSSVSTTTIAMLLVGGTERPFSATTLAADTAPNAFGFSSQTGVAPGTLAISNVITVGGINAPAAISISGGEYSVNGAAYTSGAGSVLSGDTVRVRQTASGSYSTTTVATLTIGGVSANFRVTTQAPPADIFVPQSGVLPGTLVTSNTITLSGIGAGAPLSISGGEYSLNGQPFTSASSTASDGDTVRVRQVSSASFGVTTTTTLTAGGSVKSFAVTTLAADVTPDAFSFGTRVHVTPGAEVVSGSVTVSGLNSSAAISVSGAEYSVDGGAFTSAPSTVSNGQTVTLKVIAAASYGTVTNATLTIGGVNGSFSVATRTASSIPGTAQIAAGPDITFSLRSDGTVWRWGAPPAGGTIQTTPVQMGGISGVTRVSVGGFSEHHALMLRSDGTVWAWGANQYGQLGDGTTTNREATPVQVLGPGGAGFLTDVVDVAAGDFFSLALKSDGTVWAWGENFFQQKLGIGSTAPDSCGIPDCAKTPVQVKGAGGVGFLDGVVAISAGDSHSLALKSDGTVWSWGYNFNGQLGRVGTLDQSVGQVGGLAGVIAISAGGDYSLALRSDGTVWAWGGGASGQLGDGVNTDRHAPVQVRGPGAVGFLAGVTAIAAGYKHSLALMSDGTVWSWGDNASGQLGDGSKASRNTPAQLPGLSAVISIAAAGDTFACGHSLAMQADGSVRAWGCNSAGQLGDGTYKALANRVGVTEVLKEGSIGHFSLLGDDLRPDPFHFTNRIGVARGSVSVSVPATVAGLGTASASAVSVTGGEYSVNGDAFTSAPGTVVNGDVVTVRQTASSSYNTTTVATLTIGSVSASYHVTTERDPAGFTSVTRIAAGDQHSVLLRPEGVVWAWGYGGNGQLGNGATVSVSAPGRVSNLKDVAQIAAGRFHTLALRSDGTVWAWGWNALGQAGDGSAGNSRHLPVQVLDLANVVAIAAGHTHSLAVALGGSVFAWGANTDGQLGDGTTSNRITPVQVRGPGGVGFLDNVVAVAAGEGHSLALKADGTLWAWGGNAFGQIGDGTDDQRLYPVQVLTGVAKIAAGNQHSLALRTDGSLWAWGDNSRGQLGDGMNTSRVAPVPVIGLGLGVTAIAAGQQHSLAVAASQLYAWGANENGQLGDGLTSSRNSPFMVSGMSGIVAVAGGARHTLALNNESSLFAFGDNFFGQVGNRTGNFSPQSALLNLLRGDAIVSQLLAAATSSVGTSSTTGSSSINTDGLEAAVDFGSVIVGTPAATQARKLVNRSSQTYATVQVSIATAIGPEFALVSNGCSAGNLAPEGECTVQVGHTPQAEGSRAGEMVFVGTWGGGQSLTTRVPLASTATVSGAPMVVVNPAILSFPNQSLGTTSTAQVVTLSNTGAAALEISNLLVSGDFGQANNCPISPATLTPGASCTFNVVFSPAVLGGRTGSLSFSSNALNGPSHSVSLSGTGVGAPALQLSANSLTFASRNVGTTSPAQLLTLTNSGSSTLAMNTTAVTGAQASNFVYVSSCAAALAPGANCSIDIAFSPSAVGQRTATLSINTDAADSPHSVSLSGTGVDTQPPSVPSSLTASAVSPSQINLAWTLATDNVVVATYKIYRGGSLLATLAGAPPATSYSDAGLGASTTYSYTVQACDAAGNCSADSVAASATTPAGLSFAANLEQGFNLIGNSLDITLDVAAAFGNQDAPVSGVTENIVSIWKWNAADGRWAFYSPQLTAAGIASFAADKGYEVLATIHPGEGYWVNAVGAMTLPAQSGTGFSYTPFSFSALPSGFNLIAHAGTVSPSQFNLDMSATPPSPGTVPTDNFVSLWAWDALQGKWYFHSPLLEASGGLAAVKSYADSNFYLHFQDYNKQIEIGTGFWVNRP